MSRFSVSPFSPPWIVTLRSVAEADYLRTCDLEAKSVGGVEIRWDLWGERSPRALAALVSGLGKPTILTCRRDARIAEEARLQLLLSGSEGWPENPHGLWIDVDALDPLLKQLVNRTRLISSRHYDEEVTDPDVVAEVGRLHAAGARCVKLVLASRGYSSIQQVVRLSRRDWPCPVSLSVSGIEGRLGRLLAVTHGSAWSYCRLRGSPGTDCGQPALALSRRYANARRTTGAFDPEKLRHYGVLGSDVRRSLSPSFHQAVFDSFSLRGHVFWDASLQAADSRLLATDPIQWQGFAVTTPHKGWAATVAQPGSAVEASYPTWNTLLHSADGWLGFNTDAPAVWNLLSSHFDVAPPRVNSSDLTVVILGAGATARSVAVELARHNVEVIYWVRCESVAVDLRRQGWTATVPERTSATRHALGPVQRADAVLNATGKDLDDFPWSFDGFDCALALEMRYEPRRSAFLDYWHDRGAACVEGIEMFAQQARLQAKILYGVEVTTLQARSFAETAWKELQEDPVPEDPPPPSQQSGVGV